MKFRLATRADIPALIDIMMHPSVHESFGLSWDGDGEMLKVRVHHTFENFMYVMLEDRRGFFMFERMCPDGLIYSAHVAALPSIRGAELRDIGLELKAWLTDLGVERLWAWTMHDNRRARVFARWMGMDDASSPGFCPEIYTDDEGRWMSVSLREGRCLAEQL